MKLLVTGLGALAVAIAVVWITADSVGAGFASNAAAITFIGAVALGIERVLEIGWTLVGQSRRLGGWWPLNRVRDAAVEFEAAAEQLLDPLGDLEERLLAAIDGLDQGDAATVRLHGHLDRVQAVRPQVVSTFNQARELAPGSARVSLVSTAAAQAVTLVGQTTDNADAALADIRRRINSAQGGMNTALDVIDAYRDNPARRLASLLIGSILGLVVAGLSQLNLFVATLSDDGGTLDGPLGGPLGVVVTGIVLGFGASPTHEIVKGLQRYKEGKDTGAPVYAGVVAAAAAAPTVGSIIAVPRRGATVATAAATTAAGAACAAGPAEPEGEPDFGPAADYEPKPIDMGPDYEPKPVTYEVVELEDADGADAVIDLVEPKPVMVAIPAAAAPGPAASMPPAVRHVRSTD
ncbi:MAG: hypothetical protein AAF962_13270 [Actinomycetota bacterium]